MKIIFFGSSNFALPCLKALLQARYNVLSVVTQPDRKCGRGLSLSFTPVKTTALENKIEIYQPREINKPAVIKFLSRLNPDLFVVIAYGKILSEEILNIPKILAINVHASLLPKYRGAAPINWAIIKGEKATGISIIKMTDKMDAGPLIMQETADISQEDTAITLQDKLSVQGAKLLLEALKQIENNNFHLTPQDEDNVTFAPKLQKQDGRIDWNKPAEDIVNLLRGCLPWPGAFTYYQGKLLKIYKAKVSSQVRKFASSNPGEILEASKEGIVISTGKGNITIEELQIEGKRRMKVKEFIAGHKILPREILGTKNSCSSSSL